MEFINREQRRKKNGISRDQENMLPSLGGSQIYQDTWEIYAGAVYGIFYSQFRAITINRSREEIRISQPIWELFDCLIITES